MLVEMFLASVVVYVVVKVVQFAIYKQQVADYNDSVAIAEANQCKGITKKGSRCSLWVLDFSNGQFCKKHLA